MKKHFRTKGQMNYGCMYVHIHVYTLSSFVFRSLFFMSQIILRPLKVYIF